jgi:ATP-dependent Lon protease
MTQDAKKKKTSTTDPKSNAGPDRRSDGDGDGDAEPTSQETSSSIDTAEDLDAIARPSPTSLPVLPLKNTVVFPSTFAPLSVARPWSLAAVEAALASEDKTVLLLTQKNPDVEEPGVEDLYSVGTHAVIKRMTRTEQGLQLLAQGIERMRVVKVVRDGAYLRAQVEPVPTDDSDDETKREALLRAVQEQVGKLLALAHPESAEQLRQLLSTAEGPLHLVHLVASLIQMDTDKEQALLDATNASDALQLLYDNLQQELKVQQLRQQITSKVRSEMSNKEREYLLRQQMDAIREELGEAGSDDEEVAELRKKLEEADLPDAVHKDAIRELKRLERLSTASPDYQLTRTWLEIVTELPWRESTTDSIDLQKAREVLDEDHFDLEEVKDRIIEHLAVMKLNPKTQSPILCFVGPPGVGKTSLGKSIARAIGRKFERLSLGGLHDEAELRGHRRTYIGAMPGRVIQAVRRAGVNNPLLMLDEVDKLGRDFRGDPSSALLEILDPAQNHTFRDNYLDLPFDLSKVFFICTANTLATVPGPLLDRMEVLRLAGYTEEEKSEIARRYLIPRQLVDNGIREELLTIPDETLMRIIRRYTREAGVRQLERAIGRLCRKVAVRVASGNDEKLTARVEDLPDLLGKQVHRPGRSRENLQAGVATGLAWTEAGGDILFVETTLLPNGSGIRMTGQLGSVMKESAETAQSYVWSHADQLGIESDAFKTSGLHVHVPAGAVPKDGPSAGIAIVTALTSLFTDIPARADTAMTGEITLSGRVLPIGGLKEKILAARSAGIQRIVLPKENESDLRDLPDHVREEMEFFPVETIDAALAETMSNSSLPSETADV